MTNVEILTGLLSMKCKGFSGTVMLHIDSQDEFDALSVLDPRMMLRIESSPSSSGSGEFYDVVEIQIPDGMQVYLFSPRRKTRERTPKKSAIEVVDVSGGSSWFSYIEAD